MLRVTLRDPMSMYIAAHRLWIETAQYRDLEQGVFIRVPWRNSARLPIVAEFVEVRERGATAPDRPAYANQHVVARIVSVADDGSATLEPVGGRG